MSGIEGVLGLHELLRDIGDVLHDSWFYGNGDLVYGLSGLWGYMFADVDLAGHPRRYDCFESNGRSIPGG